MATNSILGKVAIDVVEPPVNLVSCTAASDGWIVNTNNTSGEFRVFITDGFVSEPSKVSPLFTNFSVIVPNMNWTNTGWLVSSGTTFSSTFPAWNAFDGTISSSNGWYSEDNEFTASTGLPIGTDGGVFLRMDFPEAYALQSFTISIGVFSAPSNWELQGSNNGFVNFTTVQSYVKNDWTLNTPFVFEVTTPHNEFQNWRLFFTKKYTGAGSTINTHIGVSEVSFTTKAKKIKSALNASPINTASFKIQVIENFQNIVNIATDPFGGPFHIMLTKNNKIVNTGLYSFAPSGVISLVV